MSATTLTVPRASTRGLGLSGSGHGLSRTLRREIRFAGASLGIVGVHRLQDAAVVRERHNGPNDAGGGEQRVGPSHQRVRGHEERAGGHGHGAGKDLELAPEAEQRRDACQ